MNNKHEHIQAMLMYVVGEKLEELSKRGVGYIDLMYTGGIDYNIDGIRYSITIKEREE